MNKIIILNTKVRNSPNFDAVKHLFQVRFTPVIPYR